MLRKVNTKLSKVAELAMIQSIYNLLLGDIKPGRLQGKYLSLQKEIDKELSKIKVDGKKELPLIGKAYDIFAERTGWNKRERSVGTILSFVMGMIEESENKFSDKIMDLLNDIFDFHERKVPFSALCYSAGAVANIKWNNVKLECF